MDVQDFLKKKELDVQLTYFAILIACIGYLLRQ